MTCKIKSMNFLIHYDKLLYEKIIHYQQYIIIIIYYHFTTHYNANKTSEPELK